jgi:1,4-dihydroxy-2-naphthoate octaprenyltransferase
MGQSATVLRVLWAASRPSQVLLVLGVYVLGAKIADALGATPRPHVLVAGALPLLAVAVSVHYANEYADAETDALTDRTPFSGGSGALPGTGLSPGIVLWAGFAALLVGALLTAVFLHQGVLEPAAAALVLLAAVLGWQYSVGPLKLAWRGWGELVNAVLGGLLLPVYGAAVAGGPLAPVILAVVPFFLVVLLNLFATQWPDRLADGAVGKRTLAVRWSRARLRRTYAAIAIAAGASLVLLHGIVLPTAVVAASLLVVPLIALGAHGYTRRHVPWPTVTAMVGLAVLQLVAWCWVGG